MDFYNDEDPNTNTDTSTQNTEESIVSNAVPPQWTSITALNLKVFDSSFNSEISEDVKNQVKDLNLKVFDSSFNSEISEDVKNQVKDGKEIDIFNNFVDDNLIQLMVRETNKYAE
ncbi:hypothetical protein QE152_g38541 [Popillia japonica]|uniref:Uncharacterized protein n=1 Tax=Popillia japonica TaxID=7064 RepID=A0AAW1HX48_POPJA